MKKSKAYPDTPPKLIPSIVCHADILGYSQLSTEAINSNNGNKFLIKLRNALTEAYIRVRESSKGWDNAQHFSIKIFTDNIVVGYPLKNYSFDYGEGELGHVLRTFAEFQIGLAMEGFLVRGGISYGEHYMDDDIVFGDALLEAVAQDKAGGPPRITLSPSAVEALQHHLGFYGVANSNSPQYQVLLEDSDGSIYLNYLEEAFIAFPDDRIFFEVFDGHKKTIVNGLKKYESNPDIRAKYEWLARYHNFICEEFLEKHPVSINSKADEAYVAATVEAQRLSEYIIDIESLAASPRRISLHPIFPKA